ncbi:polyprenyl synthetase family protein [Streptomyces sp. NPDC016845]|uniref:polyprenyl synthetase family protein n=1 Tax=Streptomyces sp. NPDC016845 TaxID=3364972 RepID=UPI0037AD83E0
MPGPPPSSGDALTAQPPDAASVRRRIDRTARRIDHHIDRLCPHAPADASRTWLPPGHATGVGHVSEGALAHRLNRSLTAPVRHLTDAGGRRWRLALAWEAITLLGGDSERCGPLVAALELLHTGSLIVDDVQDSSPLRRGRPAAHTVFGVPAALNAGTAAYFLWERAIQLSFPDDAACGAELRGLLVAALRAAHVGQALDLQGHRQEMDQAVADRDQRTVLDLVRLTHSLKSGAPVAACLETAGVVTRAGPPLREALRAFGSAVGTAYQIADDVADLRGVTLGGALTKQVAEDLRAGKVTMPLAHAVERLPHQRLKLIWRQVRDGTGSTAAVSEACRRLEACGAVRACRDELVRTVDGAWKRLEPLLPSGGRQLLYHMAQSIVRCDQVA